MQLPAKNLPVKKVKRDNPNKFLIVKKIIQTISLLPNWVEIFENVYNQLNETFSITAFHGGFYNKKNEKIDWIFNIDSGVVSRDIISSKLTPFEHEAVSKKQTMINSTKRNQNKNFTLIAPVFFKDLFIGLLSMNYTNSEKPEKEIELLSIISSIISLAKQIDAGKLKYRNKTDSQLKEAEQVNKKLKSIIEVARAIAHELNQPLTGISGYCTLIKEELSSRNNAQIINDLDEIQKQANRLEALILKFQSVAHIENEENEQN